jgi:uncharacterized protein (TIGR00730 family)
MSENMTGNDEKLVTKKGLEIGVIGSARLKEQDEWWVRTHELGGLLAQEGYVVVTGGYGGLMAAVSRGAHEMGGHVIGLTMQHWAKIQPNPWNVDLRWSTDYGTRLNHLMRCDGIIALPGGIGTLSEMAVTWSASQTEGRAIPIVLLGDCWPPIINAIRDHLVVGDADLNLLRFANSPAEAVRELHEGLQHSISGSGPYG